MGKQIKSSTSYKDYVLAKSLKMQVEKMEEKLLTSIVSKVIRHRAFSLYGISTNRCKWKIKGIFKTTNDKICNHNETNPAAVEGSRLWAELFLHQNSFNNSLESP